MLREDCLFSRHWLRCGRGTRTPAGLPRPTVALATPHLRPPVPRWAPPYGSCPWRRGQASRPRVRSDLEGCGGSAAPAAPSLSRLPQPRPPAPLRGRGPAGSVAAEGGAGLEREADPVRPQSALFITGVGWGGQPRSTFGAPQ